MKTDYKQYRADFAKAVWLNDMERGAVDDHIHGAKVAVIWADALIAELERTEAMEQLHQVTDEVLKQDDAQQPPKLNVGWKWAPTDESHVLTAYDLWWYKDGRFAKTSSPGSPLVICVPVATPDWHNPENIEEPGEGWRFLVKGELRVLENAETIVDGEWADRESVHFCDEWTYRTPTTRPLPPVLAEE